MRLVAELLKKVQYHINNEGGDDGSDDGNEEEEEEEGDAIAKVVIKPSRVLFSNVHPMNSTIASLLLSLLLLLLLLLVNEDVSTTMSGTNSAPLKLS